MTIRPILFNGEMVRAILDGRKTCTRRAIKHNVDAILNSPYHMEHPEVEDAWLIKKLCRPPYEPGDIMYVREAWGEGYAEGTYIYKADDKPAELPTFKKTSKILYHPSIHMPKEAARIWLKVTDVRVERLQDITDDGAKAEGANWKNGKNVGWEEKMRRTAVERFAEIWDSTIKKYDLDRYGWVANPWVWVIEFERCEKPKE
jgi:hypothetical protein